MLFNDLASRWQGGICMDHPVLVYQAAIKYSSLAKTLRSVCDSHCHGYKRNLPHPKEDAHQEFRTCMIGESI